MNDSSFTIIGDEPVEARIVAWVLGEASGFEAGELERLCAERPELLVFCRRMRALHGLLTEAEAARPDEGWKLPSEKRKVLDEVFGGPELAGTKPVIEKRARHAARRVLLSIAACVMLTFVVLFLIPSDSYESEALIEVKPCSMGASMFGVQNADVAPATQMTPQFLANEGETIRSRRNLEQVADNLALEKRWSVDRETAIRKLKDSIQTENVKGTGLISIRARADNPEEAKQIASEVTKSYQAYRNAVAARQGESALAELDKAVRDQEDKVEERRKLLATIVNTKGIIYKGQDSFYNQGEIKGDQTREESIKRGLDAQDYVDAKRDFETDQELLQKLKLKKISEDVGSRIPFQSVEVQDDPLQGEPTRKSLASNLLGKVSSLGGVLGGRGDAVASKEAPAIASKRADYLPANQGMIEDWSEPQKQLAAEKRQLAQNAPVSPSAGPPPPPAEPPSNVALSTPLPAELIEGTPKRINVPNLEMPQGGPAGLSSLAEEGKSRNSTLTLGGAAETAGAVAAADAPVDMLKVEAKPAAGPAKPASPMARGGAGEPSSIVSSNPDELSANPSDALGAGSGSGVGVGGKRADWNGRMLNEAQDTGFEKRIAGSVGDQREPTMRGKSWDLSASAGVKEGVSVVDEEVPNLDEVPALGELFDGKKNVAPVSGLRSGDDSISRHSIDAIPHDGAPMDRGGFDGAAAFGSPIAGEKDARGALAEREIARRQSSVQDGDRLLMEGRDAYQKGDYQKAREKYSESLAKLPDAPVFSDRKDSVGKHLSDANTALAMQARKVGKYSEANELLKDALEKNPDNATAKSELSYLEDPIRTSPALTYEHNGKVDEVRRNLYMAEGNMNLGKYDAAKKGYEDTLRIDPYNVAARKGIEQLAAAKSQYYRAAYDHTRAELLMEVDKAWELAVPADEAEAQSKMEIVRESKSPIENAPQIPAKPDSDESLVNDPQTATLRKAVREQEDKVEERRKSLDVLVGARENILKNISPVGDLSENNELRDEMTELGVDDQSYQNAMIDHEREVVQLKQMKEMLASKASHDQPKPQPKPDLTKLMEEIPAAEEPYSTFSLNISDASFKIAQAALAKGERPDPTGVKVEQFYNAVDYGDPAPSGGEPVALASEQCAHPVIPGRDLVRVSVKTAAAGRSASQPLRLTLLVDQSGSMVRADRREAMTQALSSLAGLLTANDRVTLIGFSRTPHLLADGMSGDQAGKLPGMVHQESAEGGTNLEEAIKLAAQLAARHKLAGGQNRIVLFTDGAANLGDADPAHLAERVKTLRQGGFAFDIAGIAANDLNDELLGELARNGNGRYYIVGKGDDGSFASRLAGAFRPAAENVKVQVRFNPERVARYKLIGFEKDRLKTEDFRNDAVDAAEMAAEEAGVAIYQVETLPTGSGELGEVSVRFRDAAAGGMVERTMVLSHTGSTPAIDKASPSMQLAVLSMLAAEKLRCGALGQAIDFQRLSGPLGNVRGFYGPGGRAAEMLDMVNVLK